MLIIICVRKKVVFKFLISLWNENKNFVFFISFKCLNMILKITEYSNYLFYKYLFYVHSNKLDVHNNKLYIKYEKTPKP